MKAGVFISFKTNIILLNVLSSKSGNNRDVVVTVVRHYLPHFDVLDSLIPVARHFELVKSRTVGCTVVSTRIHFIYQQLV